MPIRYNETKKRFERDGVAISPVELRELIDKLTLATKRDARRLSARLERGEITQAAWAAGMLALLRAAHVVAASVGGGGLSQVTDSRWQKVEKKVSWQKRYLDKFGAAIVAGTVLTTVGAIASRAAKYASAVYVTFANALREEQTAGVEKEMQCRLVQNSKEGCPECSADASEGWMPVSEMGEIGSRECGDYCLCEIEFEDELL